MKIIALILISIYQTVLTAPLLKLTPAEYIVFEAALGGGTPLYMQSALQLMTMTNIKHEKRNIFVNIGGKDAKHTFKSARRYLGNDAKQTFKSGRRHYGGNDAKHAFKSGGRNYFNPKMVRPRQTSSFHRMYPIKINNNGQSNYINRRPQKDFSLPIYRNQLSNITPITKRMQLIRKQNRRMKRDLTKVEKEINQKEVQKTDDKRIKRQDEDGAAVTTDDEDDYDYDDYDYDYEEEPIRYAEELSFGLSTAGGVLGGAVGGYLDTTGTATLKLIRSLESLGLIALSQLDTFLDRQDEEKNKADEEAATANGYNANAITISRR